MTISFERPVGAAADLSELEYVSALHQTQSGKIRTDGSIRDVDIMHFLRSRYGIQVDLDTVRHTILTGLGGDFEGDGGGEEGEDNVEGKEEEGAEEKEEEEEGIDLAEMVAILLIPTLLKSAQNEHLDVTDSDTFSAQSSRSQESSVTKNKCREDFGTDREYKVYRAHRNLHQSLQPEHGLLRDVLAMILKDVTGSSTPKRLSASLMRDILVAYGEEELAQDDTLLEEMVRAATGNDRIEFLDANAFARALTSDVVLYDVENETRLTSNYDDVLMATDVVSSSKANTPVKNGDEFWDDEKDKTEAVEEYHCTEEKLSNKAKTSTTLSVEKDVDEFCDDEKEKVVTEKEDPSPDPMAEEKMKLAFSAPAVDLVADQFMSTKLVVLLWTGFVLVYFAYRSYIDKWIGQELAFAQMQEGFAACYHLDFEHHFAGYHVSVLGVEVTVGTKDSALGIKNCYEDTYTSYTEAQGVIQDWDCPDVNGRINYGCLILKSIVKWLYVLALLMFLGLAYIGLGSIGNSVRARRKWPIIFGIAAVGTMSYVFFFWFHRKEEYKFGIDFYLKYADYELIQIGNETKINDATLETGNLTVSAFLEQKKSTNAETMVDILALIVSSMAMIVQFYLLIGPLLKKCCFKDSTGAGRFLVPGSIKAEAQMKQASARKINSMVKNAREVHGNIEEGDASKEGGNMSFGQGLINFSLKEKHIERAGGFLWTWKRIFSGEISSVEGVWISARIWAGNLAQVLISIFVIFWGLETTRAVVEKWREGITSDELLFTILGWFGINLNTAELAQTATDNLEHYMNEFMALRHGALGCGETLDGIIDHFESNSPLNVSEVDPSYVCNLLEHAIEYDLYNVSEVVGFVTSSATNALNGAVGSLSDGIYPAEERMVKAPLLTATVVAFLSGVTLSLIYIPSVISTTLQLRSGVIPFFHDTKNQSMYRTAMDQVTILLGSMFWGLLYSAVLLGAIIGGIVFLFLWQATSKQMAVIFAQLVGLAITITIKMIIVIVFLRATVYVGYYRKRPVQGNIVSLILEVANIGYAIGTALGRAFILVLISVLYIGRLDTPLLADGISAGPLRDTYPTIFRKDILSHEAHRHPYLEVLGTMYMFKIRYGEKFGNKAGYCFRLIFAVALMPWIRKYRVLARPNLLDDEDRKKKVEGEQIDNSVLLPKTSILKASLIAMGTSTRNQLTENEESDIMELKAEVEKWKAEANRYREALAVQGFTLEGEQQH